MNLKEIITNPVERSYFEGLLSKLSEKQTSLVIDTNENKTGVFPTAIAPSHLTKHLPWRSYEDIKKNYSSSEKSPASLWLRKMHGGIGSSIKRNDYIKKYGREKIGAKGTDLFINTSHGPISIAEAQLIQAEKKTTSFNKVIFQDILNEEVKELFDGIWKKVSPKNVIKFDPLVQSNVPTLDSNKELTLERRAPAGHGLFGYEILHSIFDESKKPSEKNLICCIGNGEDLSSTPDKSVANWMIEEEVPICMVTTTKTRNDMKGGQIALWDKKEEGVFLTIIEKAQAEEAGQLELFSEIGLRDEDADAFFNTNLVLLNIDVLTKLFEGIDKDELLAESLPDLIQNKKKQDGKEFIQLEGAMGSVFLNLDNYWRRKFKKPLIHIMNVSKENRTRFFSPIKSAFDYFMQFHSDRFTFNEETFHLINNKPGTLPRVTLPDDYKDISVVLEKFEDSKLLDLEVLNVSQLTDFKGKNLQGQVSS